MDGVSFSASSAQRTGAQKSLWIMIRTTTPQHRQLRSRRVLTRHPLLRRQQLATSRSRVLRAVMTNSRSLLKSFHNSFKKTPTSLLVGVFALLLPFKPQVEIFKCRNRIARGNVVLMIELVGHVASSPDAVSARTLRTRICDDVV